MASERASRWENRFLTIAGAFVVAHSLFILAYAATAQDFGLRILLVDDPAVAQTPKSIHGVRIAHVLPNVQFKGARPDAGDLLISVTRDRIESFNDFARVLGALRSMSYPAGDLLVPTDLIKEQDKLPPLVQMDGQRWVEVEFLSSETGKRHHTWLMLQPLPAWELSLSFVWFILEFGIFMVGALAFWSRPFDRQARLFYAMCVVTIGGFVGGYHWWLIAGSSWLTVPFAVCAMLLPVVTLHFFLVYPEPIRPFDSKSVMAVVALYAFPVICSAILVAMMSYGWWLQEIDAPSAEMLSNLKRLSLGINFYFVVAALYFTATLVALLYSFFRPHHPLVHSQVKWILGAALLATVPVGYTLYLSKFQKVEFALGKASLPMFTASLLFMLAYAVGIIRYKLMLVDQILSRGMLYYAITFLVTLAYSAAIASSSLLGLYQTKQISQRMLSVTCTIVATVLLMGWFRDRLQQVIDRRFFREKYQLDKALLRMNQSADYLVAPEMLAERMLNSCRDVLGISRGAVYLRDPGSFVLRMLAAERGNNLPLQFPCDQQFLNELQSDHTQTRSPDEPPESASRTQSLLRDFQVELIHALEAEGSVDGAVLLGPKTNGVSFTAEDLTFLTTLGQITAVALHSARVHQTAARLSEELQAHLEKISEQQRSLSALHADRAEDQRKIADQQRMIAILQGEITSRQPGLPAPETGTFQRELIKGHSTAVVRVLDTVKKVSGSQSSVLIRGESGTGKELLAQTLHNNSPRRAAALVSVHCGALSAGVLESELFGHVKGAFTGAHRDRPGRFELAHGGTLFLDEIGDISLETQIKLLRVLQERRFEPVGGSRSIEVDVRLIAATHQNLEQLISEGRFREDLFYRLNVISITLPALRERGDDIFELALHFLGRAAERTGKRVSHFDDDALTLLRNYPWPGNIRELENAIERAVVLAEKPTISVVDLPPLVVSYGSSRIDSRRDSAGLLLTESAGIGFASELAGANARAELVTTLTENSEREQLQDALRRSGGNKAEAARLLGLPRSTFFSRLKKHSLS